MLGDVAPVFRPVLLDEHVHDFVFLLCPGPLHQIRVEHLLPAVQALDVAAVFEVRCDFFPILGPEFFNKLFQLLVFFLRPPPFLLRVVGRVEVLAAGIGFAGLQLHLVNGLRQRIFSGLLLRGRLFLLDFDLGRYRLLRRDDTAVRLIRGVVRGDLQLLGQVLCVACLQGAVCVEQLQYFLLVFWVDVCLLAKLFQLLLIINRILSLQEPE